MTAVAKCVHGCPLGGLDVRAVARNHERDTRHRVQIGDRRGDGTWAVWPRGLWTDNPAPDEMVGPAARAARA